MSRIFLPPSPRTQQPPQLTGINRGSGLGKHVLFVQSPSFPGLYGEALDLPWATKLSTLRATPSGMALETANDATSYSKTANQTIFGGHDALSCFSVWTVLGANGKSSANLVRKNGEFLPFQVRNSNTVRAAAWVSTVVKITSELSISYNTEYRALSRWKTGSPLDLLLTPALTNSTTAASGTIDSSSGTPIIFGNSEGLGESVATLVPLTVFFDTWISDAEYRALRVNPWQVLAPQSRSFYFNTGSGTQALTPSLFVNSNTFHAATVTPGSVALTPALYADSDTFYAPTVSLGGGPQDLDPALFVNSNTFHAPTVAGSNSITPSLFSNSNAFHNAMVAPGAVDLAPSLYADTDSFYSATVSAGGNLSPSLYVNANSFHAATVSPGAVGLTPDLFADSDTFYSAAITNGLTLSPALYVDADSFYAPTVTPGSVALTPALYTDSDTFYAPTVSGASVNLSPALFTDTDTFYGSSVAASTELQPILVINANSFYVPSIGRGAVNLSPALFANDQTFYTHSIGNGADEQYPLAGLTQLYPLDGLTQQYPLS